MKLLNLLLILIFLTPDCIPQHQILENKIKDLAKTETLRHGQWGVYAEYVEDGNSILNFNEEMSLAPASGLKVFTTSAALNILGENYTYKTSLYYEGEITSDGILRGNIFIKGGGDPTLGSNKVKGSLSLDSLMQSWIASIKKLNIKKIEGSVFADASFFDDQTVPDYWPWIDIGNYYGAGPNSLSINDNLYYLFFKPADQLNGKAEVLRTEPIIPGLIFSNHMRTGRKGSGDNGYIYAAPGQFEAVLRGTIPAGVDEFSIKGSIPNPPLFAAQYLTSSLKENSIDVTFPAAVISGGKIYQQSKLVHTTVSPPLKEIVYVINQISFNLYTEHLLKTLGLEQKGTGSTEAGIEVMKNFLDSAGISTGGFELYDGSGLSRTNMITAKMMVKLLSFMSWQKSYTTFFNSLVEFKLDDDKKAWVKTGLINGVRSHSGYVLDNNGELISFSFIANNFPGKVSDVNDIHKQLMLELSQLN